MSFRILEISNPAELHIHHHQLEITENEDTYRIPVDDLDIVIAFGPEIRLSTNDLMLLAAKKVLLMTINHHYLPVSMTLSFVNNHRFIAALSYHQFFINPMKIANVPVYTVM